MSKQRRGKAPDRLGRYVAPLPRFAAGISAMPPFLMLDSLPSKAFLVVLFAVMAVLAGKRIRWTYFLILGASVTFFHLLAPVGRVLVEIGPFPLTLGALENGIGRGLTLTGMVFLSLASVKPELELPGRFGGLLARTFYYFEVVLDGKVKLSRKDFFGSLDQLLLERFDPREDDFGHGGGDTPDSATALPAGNRRRGWIPALVFLAVPWGLWILSLSGILWI